MKELQASSYPVPNKFLPVQSEANKQERLNIDFSEWDIANQKQELVIEEYLWGVRCGVSQYINIENCSLASVLEIAKTDHMCEIYSPVKVQYFLDGSRKVVPHQVSAYNTEAKFDCYHLIDLQQAINLFPLYKEMLQALPEKTMFLCSPDGDKIRIVNQEVGEVGFNFSYADCEQKNIAFRLGHLRATFEYIAQQITDGKGENFCQRQHRNEVDYLFSKINFLAGGKYSYDKAVLLASEEAAKEIRNLYIQEGFKGRRDFTVLIDGSFSAEWEPDNKFVEVDGKDITICVPPSVYKSWGMPFNAEELKLIFAKRKFDFNNNAEYDYFCKINQLRFDRREIWAYRQSCSAKIIEVEELEEIMKKQLCENETKISGLVKHGEQLVQQEYRARDTSGPSRSSIYTNF